MIDDFHWPDHERDQCDACLAVDSLERKGLAVLGPDERYRLTLRGRVWIERVLAQERAL